MSRSTDAQNRAKAKYNAKTYKSISLNMKIQDFEIFENARLRTGYESRSQFIFDAIAEKISRDLPEISKKKNRPG